MHDISYDVVFKDYLIMDMQHPGLRLLTKAFFGKVPLTDAVI